MWLPVVLLTAVGACKGSDGTDEGTANAAEPRMRAKAAPEVAALPTAEYVAARPWTSRTEPSKTHAPPSPSDETWRVLVHQQVPMQIETPRWQRLPATENVVLRMQSDSRFRCLVTPLSVTAESDDFGRRLEAWVLERELRCSSDGWHSWHAYTHQVRVETDGTRDGPPTRAWLHARADDARGDGSRRTLVLLRDDAERRRATTGPPRIIASADDRDD
jgi:hypothetical protein